MDAYGRYLFGHEKTVQHYHTGPQGHMTISAMCRFAQESAGCHAGLLGFGSRNLAEQGIAWVLREQAMRIVRVPVLGETLRVCTWPTRAERILCHRDYRVLDSQGDVVALGTSAWFGLDLQTRRPRKAESFFSLPWELLPPPALDGPLPELEAPAPGGPSETRAVRASDIDALGHMNNLRYVDWIRDHLARCGLDEPGLHSVHIRYVREVSAGDRVVVGHDMDGAGDVRVAMYGEEHGREVCLARVSGGKRQGMGPLGCPGREPGE